MKKELKDRIAAVGLENIRVLLKAALLPFSWLAGRLWHKKLWRKTAGKA